MGTLVRAGLVASIELRDPKEDSIDLLICVR